jgi:hypothetical protein
MTKARNEYIYKFTGLILGRTVAHPSFSSKYAGQEYYKLKIQPKNQPPKTLQVFKEKLINPAL